MYDMNFKPQIFTDITKPAKQSDSPNTGITEFDKTDFYQVFSIDHHFDRYGDIIKTIFKGSIIFAASKISINNKIKFHGYHKEINTRICA